MALGRNGLWRSALFLVACALALASQLPQTGLVRSHAKTSDSQPGSFAGSRPAGCAEVTPAEGLQTEIDAAPAGGVICLADGVYSGPVLIEKPLTIWGSHSAIIQSMGSGSTLTVLGDQVQLLGLTVRGSGNRFDLNDSALKVNGSHVLIQGLRLEGALFGLTAEQASDVTFRGNTIDGDAQKPLGLRGDAVRLWQTRDSKIEQNRITDCRDIIIWYSSHTRVANNVIDGGRYGTHFMYSDHEEVLNNRYYRTVVGIFSMYAHAIIIRRNLIQDASQSDGMGIGVKDSDGLLVDGNRIVRDNTGIYLDASPRSAELQNVFRRNLVALNNAAIVFHAAESNTTLKDNSFRDNQIVISVEGNGDGLHAKWVGNYFEDYQGYDLNHDGFGDVPYELRSFSTELTDHYPNLAFFRGSPSMKLMEFFSKVFPYLQPKLILRDAAPRMRPLGTTGGLNGH